LDDHADAPPAKEIKFDPDAYLASVLAGAGAEAIDVLDAEVSLDRIYNTEYVNEHGFENGESCGSLAAAATYKCMTIGISGLCD
jgi:hypothetical protein